MEILSFPIGLVVGVVPVIGNLGPPSAGPAEVLLDGRPVCTMVPEAPRCEVDLGADPRVHLLELIRRGNNGEVIDRALRWVNRPGAAAEVFVGVRCSLQTCEVSLGWAHPNKLEPAKLLVSVDERIVVRGEPVSRVTFRAPPGPTVLAVEVWFRDGSRASRAMLIGERVTGEVQTTLRAVPVEWNRDGGVDPQQIPATLGGSPVRAVEAGAAELVFVVEPHALESASESWQAEAVHGDWADRARAEGQINLQRFRTSGGLHAPASISLILAVEGLPQVQLPVGRDWARSLLAASQDLSQKYGKRPRRVADAVAVAGLAAGAAKRRRMVVLVLGGKGPDESRFTPAQALRYLQETMVPILVWKTKRAAGTPWPRPQEIASNKDFQEALDELDERLARQVMVWVEGELHPSIFRPVLPPGLSIAGQGEAAEVGPAGIPPAAGTFRSTETGTSGALLGPPEKAKAKEKGAGQNIAISEAAFGLPGVLARLAVRGRSVHGHSVADLRPDELSVFLDGQPTQVVNAEPWQPLTALFIAQELCSRSGLATALGWLGSRAELLLKGGPVTVVLADPVPRIVAQSVDTAASLRRVLEDNKLLLSRDGRAVRTRQRFLEASRSLGEGQGPGERLAQYRSQVNQAQISYREELAVARAALGELVTWTRGTSWQRPLALFLVATELDAEPGPLYLRALEPPLDVQAFQRIEEELRAPGLGPTIRDVAATLVAQGSRLFPVVAGVSATGSNNPAFQSSERLEGPAVTLADGTGGRVVTPSTPLHDVPGVFEGLTLLTLRTLNSKDGKVHAVSAATSRPGVVLTGPGVMVLGTSEVEAELRIRRVLSGQEQAGPLPVRLVIERTSGASTKESQQSAVLVVQVSLSTPPAIAGAGSSGFGLRVSLGVEVEGREPSFRHVQPERVALGDDGVWTYRIPITFPQQAKRLAVVVEDLGSGAWGAAVRESLAPH